MLIKSCFLIGTFTCSFFACYAQPQFPDPVYPLHVIFDTDFGPDYDDVGAITLLHCFADSGYIRILATISSSKHKNAAAAINVFNTYFRRPQIPVGVVKGNAVALGDKQHWTDTVISRYPHNISNNQDVPDALELYRKILASRPDHSDTIVTVGFLTNLANLLESKPDISSSLNGTELVKKKVRNLVCMAGRFPSGKEFNLDQDVVSSRKVLANWPTTILFSGFEIGQKIKTGIPLIHNEQIRLSPVKDVFAICIPMAQEDSAGRMSWDETAVFVAVKGWRNYYNLETGTCAINSEGFNEWIHQGNMQAHLVEKQSPLEMRQIINQLIMHQPAEIVR
ncbi:MAG: nucleoside hydrolase [Bacteroidota bacterium]|nr:nucleoside hydrolase [Bacteroidota bacterium]